MPASFHLLGTTIREMNGGGSRSGQPRPVTLAKINVLFCLPSRRAAPPAATPKSEEGRESNGSAVLPLGLPEDKRQPTRLDSPLLLETGRRKILAFVYGSKDVVISTGRAIGKAVMGATSSASSPEPDDAESMAAKLHQLLLQQPCRMSDMLKVIGILGEAGSNEKEELIKLGIMSRILGQIEQCCHLEPIHSRVRSGGDKRHPRSLWSRRPSTAGSAAGRGVGYGRGSTKSRWDIERTVEEKIAQEEHLMWLLCSLTTFLCGDALNLIDTSAEHLQPPKDQPAVPTDQVNDLVHSPILTLFEYHFNNDSVFDISQHMDFYQALIELAAAVSFLPQFLPHMVHPKLPESKSIAKELIPRFRATLNSYPNSIRGQASPDFALMDFTRRVNDLSDVGPKRASALFQIILRLTRKYEQSLPPEQRVKTAVPGARRRPSAPSESASAEALEGSGGHGEGADLNTLYTSVMHELQIQTQRILDDNGKPTYGFTFKKELRNLNPFSPSLKDRTRRIAKELASMHNALPLNASNSIFVCMDETRCDLLKVLISGPDDTPYQNGLFEFDVFFPNNYPQGPPKVAFLTTGSGAIRFNPNLYNDGKICLSILGTWEGRPEEKWNPFCSLLQVLISIQGLIFVKNPYFNEPGFEKFQGTQKGEEYSRKYNLHIENATLLYAVLEMYKSGPHYFKNVILRHFWLKRQDVIKQAEKWLQDHRAEATANTSDAVDPENVTDTTYMPPVTQRQYVQRLIVEFQQMKNPMENEY